MSIPATAGEPGHKSCEIGCKDRATAFPHTHESESFPVFDQHVKRTDANQLARNRARAADCKETSFERISRHDCGGSISMARKRRGPRGEKVVGRAEPADSRLSRQVAGPCCNREAIDGVVRKNFTKLFFARLAAGNLVRDKIPATKTATAPGDACFGRRSQVGKGRAGPERAGCQRHDRDRLVRAITGW